MARDDLDVSISALIDAADWDRVAQRLCSLAYVQSKAAAGMIFDLVTEYDKAASAIPPSHWAAGILPILATALRRNATFISHHPGTVLQCFWNSCWWHDSADLDAFSEAFVGQPSRTLERTANGPVSKLMEEWRAQQKATGEGSAWVRSLLPPTTPIDSHLRIEIPIDAATGLPASLSVEGEQLVACFRDSTDRNRFEPLVWNYFTGEPIHHVDTDVPPFVDPSLSRDGRLKVSFGGKEGGWGHPVRVSDATNGAEVAAFPTDEDHNVYTATISADGTFVAAGATGIDFEGYVYIWDLRSLSLRVMLEPSWSVSSVSFSPTSDEFVVGTSHGDVEIWSLANSAIRTSWHAHDSWITAAKFSSDGKLVASTSDDGTIRIWDFGGEPGTRRFAPHPDHLAEAKYSPDGHRLVTRSSNGTTWLWDGDTGKPIKRLYGSSGFISMGGDARDCIFAGNHMIVSVSAGGGVWKSLDGYRLADVTDRVYLRQSISFSTDGKRFALWDGWPSSTGTITIHDIATGETRRTPINTDTPPDDSADQGGEFLTTLSQDGEFRTHRLPARVELARIQAHVGATTGCAFSADNTLLVTGGADDSVKVWDWETATEIFSADITSVTLAPPPKESPPDEEGFGNADEARIQKVKFVDDHTIAAAIVEDQIALWNFRTGEHLTTLHGEKYFNEFPRRLRYRAEHRSDEVCVVDTETGKEIAWFHCGRSLGSGLTLVPHPNGSAWAGMLGKRVFHLALEWDRV